jgi:hypothetical protein
VMANYRLPSRNRGEIEGRGRQADPSAGWQRAEGTDALRPPRLAGRHHEGHRGRDRWLHEVSRAGAGIWPGRKTVTWRRRPVRHTGHRVMSTPVTRNMSNGGRCHFCHFP